MNRTIALRAAGAGTAVTAVVATATGFIAASSAAVGAQDNPTLIVRPIHGVRVPPLRKVLGTPARAVRLLERDLTPTSCTPYRPTQAASVICSTDF